MRAALGFAACQSKKGNSLIIRLLPLQGVGLVWRIFTQGVALGYVLLPLRGVLLVSFDTPSPDVCSKSVIRVSSVCSVGADFCTLKISQKKLWNPPPNPMQILYK